MADALAKGLTDAYRENANVVVIDASNGSSGLVRDDYYNWPAKLPELVAEQKPDAILVMIGANDRQAMQDGRGRAGLRQRRLARRLYGAHRGTGRCAEGDRQAGALGRARAGRARAPCRATTAPSTASCASSSRPRACTSSTCGTASPTRRGSMSAFGPDVRGQSVQLRADDGLNFTRAGQRKLAYFVEQDLNDIFGGAAPRSLAPAMPARREHRRRPERRLHRPDGAARCARACWAATRSPAAMSAGTERGKVATAIAARRRRRRTPTPPPAGARRFLSLAAARCDGGSAAAPDPRSALAARASRSHFAARGGRSPRRPPSPSSCRRRRRAAGISCRSPARR